MSKIKLDLMTEIDMFHRKWHERNFILEVDLEYHKSCMTHITATITYRTTTGTK